MESPESTKGKIYRISVSAEVGTKKANVPQAQLVARFGILGDAHAGSDRQVSLLPHESFAKINNDALTVEPGEFAENITTEGISFSSAVVGQRLFIGNSVELLITQIGKECHEGCYIRQVVGDCIMPREGVFAQVIQGGLIQVGDRIGWHHNDP